MTIKSSELIEHLAKYPDEEVVFEGPQGEEYDFDGIGDGDKFLVISLKHWKE